MRPPRVYIEDIGRIYFVTQGPSEAHYFPESKADQAAGSSAGAKRIAYDLRLNRHDGAASTPLVSTDSSGFIDVPFCEFG